MVLVFGTTTLGEVGVLLVVALPVSWMSVPVPETAVGSAKVSA